MNHLIPQPSQNAHPEAALDRVGAIASLTCAVHCALMPLVLTLLPLVGLSFLADDRIEWLLVGFSALTGVTSLCLGYRKHRSRRALAVLSIGLAMLVAGRIAEQRHLGWPGVAVVVLGGLTIASAHVFNRYLCQTCKTCHAH